MANAATAVSPPSDLNNLLMSIITSPKPNSAINDASPSEIISPNTRRDSFVFSRRNVFFFRKKKIIRISMLITGEMPVARAAPSMPSLHGKIKT